MTFKDNCNGLTTPFAWWYHCTKLHMFYIVSRSHRNKRKRVVEERRGSAHQRSRTKKKDTELKNFYRFQIRDDKMKQLDTLRKKFEEDKERVAKMKDARKFKPF